MQGRQTINESQGSVRLIKAVSFPFSIFTIVSDGH
jgi:hypothetical protein